MLYMRGWQEVFDFFLNNTSDLKVSMIMPVCEQRLWQLPQENFEQRGDVIGMKVPRLQIYISPGVQHLFQGGLP